MNGSSYKQWWQDETWALVLYWTVYKFRFIYFVITKNLALTETPEKMKVFWKYIGKTVD